MSLRGGKKPTRRMGRPHFGQHGSTAGKDALGSAPKSTMAESGCMGTIRTSSMAVYGNRDSLVAIPTCPSLIGLVWISDN